MIAAISEYLDLLPRKAVVNILLAALDEMKSFNGQDQESAICRAMGSTCYETDSGKTVWNIPPFKETKQKFNY